jgi:hypothetical protein
MAHGDNPADRYNHRVARERDQERPVGDLPEAIRGVAVDSSDTQRGDIEHFDAAAQREGSRRSLLDGGDDRAGAGGAPDTSAGDPGGTLGTHGGRREQDR